MTDKKLSGIWIDNQRAIVVKNHDIQKAGRFFVCEPVKHHIQHGNSSENAANNAEKTNKAKFFKEIENLITNTEALYVTGPGVMQEELKNYLHDSAQFKDLDIELGTDQQMSDDKFLEKVKEHYNA